MEITFERPEAFWLLGLALLPICARAIRRRRTYVGMATVGWLPSTLRSSRLRGAPLVFLLLAYAAVVFALAAPVVPLREHEVTSHGLDLALVLDLSSSMEEVMGGEGSQPVRRTRLDVTKRAILDFIGRRPADRIGLVVFSDNAYVVSPLTLDHEYLRRYVSSIDEHTLRSEGMTAIGEGVTTANALLRRQALRLRSGQALRLRSGQALRLRSQQVAEARQRNGVLIIFTDGEHNHGSDPVEAVGTSFDAGYRVHLIGVDLDDEVKQKPAVLRLVRAVERGGGHYFTADSDRQLERVSALIDRLERGVLVSVRHERSAPAYAPFAIAAILLTGVATLLGAVPFFVELT